MTRTCPQDHAAQIAVAYRLAGMEPCREDDEARGYWTCIFCGAGLTPSDPRTYVIHDDDCLWVQARQAAGFEDA